MYEFLSARIGEWFRTVDAVLRRRRYGLHSAMDLSGADGEILTGRQVTWLVIVCGVFYGAGMGAYAYIVGQRTLWEQLPQMFYSSIKVPLLIGVTMMVALPSFFILNTLLGLRDDFLGRTSSPHFGSGWTDDYSRLVSPLHLVQLCFPVVGGGELRTGGAIQCRHVWRGKYIGSTAPGCVLSTVGGAQLAPSLDGTCLDLHLWICRHSGGLYLASIYRVSQRGANLSPVCLVSKRLRQSIPTDLECDRNGSSACELNFSWKPMGCLHNRNEVVTLGRNSNS